MVRNFEDTPAKEPHLRHGVGVVDQRERPAGKHQRGDHPGVQAQDQPRRDEYHDGLRQTARHALPKRCEQLGKRAFRDQVDVRLGQFAAKRESASANICMYTAMRHTGSAPFSRMKKAKPMTMAANTSDVGESR